MKIALLVSVCLLSQVTLSIARVRAAAVMLGAPEKMDSDDPYIQAAAEFAVLEINNQARGRNVRVLVSVKEATTQVVAGILYKMVLEMGESEYCEKDDDYPLETVPTLEDCPVDEDTINDWYADVWMKPVYPLQFEMLSLQEEGEEEEVSEDSDRSQSESQ